MKNKKLILKAISLLVTLFGSLNICAMDMNDVNNYLSTSFNRAYYQKFYFNKGVGYFLDKYTYKCPSDNCLTQKDNCKECEARYTKILDSSLHLAHLNKDFNVDRVKYGLSNCKEKAIDLSDLGKENFLLYQSSLYMLKYSERFERKRSLADLKKVVDLWVLYDTKCVHNRI